MKIKNIKEIRQFFVQYKTPVLYSGGSIAKSLSTLVVGFIIAKYVSPNDMGVWTTINLAVTYSIFLQAGLINGLNLELPYSYGKGDENNARLMAGTVQTYTVITSLIVLLVGLFFFLFVPQPDAKVKYGILAITFVIVLTFYQNYLTSTFRSNNSFLKLSFIQVVDACMNLLTIVFVIYFAYYGLIIKAVLLLLIYVILLHFSRPIKVGLIWDKIAFLKLLKVGLPIFGLAYIETLASTTDKIFLIKFTNLTDVGLYSFGLYGLNLFTLFSLSIASYVYPKMTYNFGQNNDKLILWNYAKKITSILLLIQIPLAIIGYNLIPILVTTFFPKYIGSTYIMQILLLAGVFKGSVVGVNALWSIKSWKYMIIYQITFSFLLILFPYLGILLVANKLEAVSYGVLVACFLNFISGATLTYLATHEK